MIIKPVLDKMYKPALSLAKSLLLTLLLSYWLSLSNNANASIIKPQPTPIANIVAIVGTTLITNTEFNQAVTNARLKLRLQNLAVPPPAVLRRQVLNKLINDTLQLELAQQNGLTISATELHSLIQKIAMSNHLSISALYQQLSAAGITASDYQRQLSNSLLFSRLQQQILGNDLKVTPTEINTFLKQHHNASTAKEYHVIDLLISVPEHATAAQLKAAAVLAHKVARKLQHHSHGYASPIKAVQYVDLGWRQVTELPTIFAKIVVTMPQHEYSQPLRAANGWHIINLIGWRYLPQPSLSAMSAATAKEIIFQHKLTQAVTAWLQELRAQSVIIINDPSLK